MLLSRAYSWFLRNRTCLFLVLLLTLVSIAGAFLAQPWLNIHGFLAFFSVPIFLAGWAFGPWGGVLMGGVLMLISLPLAVLWNLTTWKHLLDSSPMVVLIVMAGYLAGLFREQKRQKMQLAAEIVRCQEIFLLLNRLTEHFFQAETKQEQLQFLVWTLRELLHAARVDLVELDEPHQQTRPMVSTEVASSVPFLTWEKLNSLTAHLSVEADQAFILCTPSKIETIHFHSLKELQLPSSCEFFFFLSSSSPASHPIAAVLWAKIETPSQLSQEEIFCLRWVILQIKIFLEMIEREDGLQKQLQRNQALTHILQGLNQTEFLGLETLLQRIVDSGRELIPTAQKVVLHLLNAKEQILIPAAVSGQKTTGATSLNMRLGEGIAGQVFATGQSIYVKDVFEDPRFIQPGIPVEYRSLLVVPIKKSQEEVIGTISMDSLLPDAFTSEDVEFLETLGIHAAIAIENSRLLEATQQDLQELAALYQINQMLVSSLDAQTLFEETVRLIHGLFGFYHIQILTLDEKKEHLVLRAASGKRADVLLAQGHKIPVGTGIVGHVAEVGQPFFTNNVDAVVFHLRHPLLEETKSELAIPIKSAERLWGVLDIQEKPPAQINEHQMNLMQTIANQLAVALEKAHLYQQLQEALEHERRMRDHVTQQERLAVAGRLLASISHELNNPLQAIQNALFLIRQDKTLSSQAQQDLEIILAETQRMASLLGRLRRSYRPVQEEDFQLTDLNTLVEDVYALTATFLRHRNITFAFYPDSQLPPIPLIPDLIRQVLLNLVMNAVDAMPEGGTLSVTTALLSEEKQALLTIADTGLGLNPKIMPHIFEPFITDKAGGTGLGLTICAEVVEKHRGRIWAENNPQGGAIFKILLPISRQGEEGDEGAYSSR